MHLEEILYEILSVTDEQTDVSPQRSEMSAGLSNDLFLEVRGLESPVSLLILTKTT